ncbi:MAG TPA: hypothetical protein VJ873_07720 [bacterium]|nr:hypothetical protein [bacterium]
MVTHRILAYLIGLALGYWVLTHAEKEKAKLKAIGRVIGWIIIVVSFIGPLCLVGGSIYCHTHGDTCTYSAECPWNGGKMGGPGMMHCPGMMGDKDAKPDEGKSK